MTSFFLHEKIRNMKQKFLSIAKYILQIILTALASAGIALLQQWIESHGVNIGPQINPQDTGIIGGTVSGASIAWRNLKTRFF